ncbi:MAG: hypothetical protein ACYSX0_07345 [Planctomycetota bacterium]
MRWESLTYVMQPFWRRFPIEDPEEREAYETQLYRRIIYFVERKELGSGRLETAPPGEVPETSVAG